MLHTHKFMVTAILCIATLGACVTGKDRNDNSPQIQSTQELEAYLQATPNSPLNRLSPDAKEHFVNSLMFTDKGLGSFQYSELKTLPATDIQQVLSLFGVERTISLFTKESAPSNLVEEIDQDHEGYQCVSVGTCMSAAGYICTSNC